MKLENFEEWFAIRPNHSDEGEHLPGRLTFNLNEGISLDTIWFLDDISPKNKELVLNQTLTGWLDYRQPATLINPKISRSGGMCFGLNSLRMRHSQRFNVDAILKNVFLKDIKDKIFKGLSVEHPAFHAWINPSLVQKDWKHLDGNNFPTLFVEAQPPKERVLNLSDGTRVTVISSTRTPRGAVTTLEENTLLKLEFPNPVDYDSMTRMVWRLNTLFEFLIGARLSVPIYNFPTTQKCRFNNEDCELVAEFWYRPASRKKRRDTPPEFHSILTFEKICPVSLEALLTRILGDDDDELIYLADQIQSTEDYDVSIVHAYVEIIGCLEAFDKRKFGSGKDKNFKNKLKSLNSLIKDNGTTDDAQCFERIKSFLPNSYSLFKRLERLHSMWSEEGFGGALDLKRIIKLRNMVPHGQGHEVSADIAKEMINYLKYLTGLGRYHVMRELGFKGDQMRAALLRNQNRYGIFIPKDIIASQYGNDAVSDL